MPITLAQARTAKAAAKTLLADVREVVGIGISKSNEDYVVKVNVRSKTTRIPGVIAGVPVTVDVTGPVKKR